MVLKVLSEKLLVKLLLVDGDGKIEKILAGKCDFDLVVGDDFEVALFHDLNEEGTC